MNTADFLLRDTEDSRIALITGEAEYTYGDLKLACSKVATTLKENGILPGDRVGITGANSFFWVSLYLGIWQCGAVAVPFDHTLPVTELQALLEFTGCKALGIPKKIATRLATALNPTIKILDEGILERDSNKGVAPEQGFRSNPDTDASLMFTSGSTSQPKIVRVTHKNIQANTASIIQALELSRDERIMVILPFHYCFGTSLLHTHLRVGGTLVLNNTFAYPETTLNMLQATGCTGLAGVPSVYQTLLRNTSFPRRRFLTLKKLQQAGGRLSEVFIKELLQVQPDLKLYVMYGQTEATARLSYLPPDLLETRRGSIGKGIPGVTLRVLDKEGNEVKPGQEGEIIAEGDNISPGYLNNPEASTEKFVDGKLHTGDLATIDEDGFIYIHGRKGEFIKSLGYRVSTTQIEEGISQIPDVREVAVKGKPDPVKGEAIVAFVVLNHNSNLSVAEIQTFCRSNFPVYRVPSEVIIVKALPRNSSGKVNKAALTV